MHPEAEARTHNGRVYREWRPTGTDPQSDDSDPVLLSTIGGLVGDRYELLLRDMCTAGVAHVIRFCEMKPRPPHVQICAMNKEYRKFLELHEECAIYVTAASCYYCRIRWTRSIAARRR